MIKYYIVRECKKKGVEVRLRPAFDDRNDAKANADILKAGDKDNFYWIRTDLETLVIVPLSFNPVRIIVGDAMHTRVTFFPSESK